LTAGPWFWPSEGDFEAAAVAREVAGPVVSEAKPGRIPLLAYHGASGKGSIWLLDPHLNAQADDVRDFRPTAQASWADAASAVPRSAPILWNSLRSIVERTPLATYVGGQGRRQAAVLDDRSFGLAFALSMMSQLTGCPLPADVTATATIDEYGRLGRVGGLAAKVAVLSDFAPRVRRLLVAKEQEDEAVEVAAKRVDVVAVEHLTDALDEVFELSEHLVRAGRDQTERAELVDAMFRLAAGRTDTMVDWTPVGRAAKRALSKWPELTEDQVRKLTFAHAIACRHSGNSGHLEIPPNDWLDGFPQPLRLEVVAHVVQQATDAGAPEPRQTLEFARPFLMRGKDAFPQHLRLLGAAGRLHFILGNHRQALDFQLEAIEGWFERRGFAELSYPISFAFTVAAALEDAEAVEQLQQYDRDWRLQAGAERSGAAFVDTGRGRAAALLGAYKEAQQILLDVLERPHLMGHLKKGALRWLMFSLEEVGALDEARRVLQSYRQLFSGSNGSADSKAPPDQTKMLIALDRAVRQHNADEASRIARVFVREWPQPMSNMLRFARLEESQKPTFIQRFFPY
jgi:tetratricopeptide (TPR) repeat protein